MKKKYIYLLLAPVLFAFFGCEDNLDTVPSGDIITTEQKEEVVANDGSKAAASVNAVFAQFSQYMPNENALNASRHNDFGYPSVMLFTDANGYDVVSEDNGYNWTGNNLDYTDRDYTSRECQIIWNDMYAMIRSSNNVIGAIDSETDDPTSQYYLAQGLAVRSFSYWVLAQLFQFNYVGNETALCVPIITNENENDAALEGAPRATVKEVYDLITSDINSAITLLKSAEDNGIVRDDKRYVSLAVAYGLRARTNLAMQKWPEAAADATSAINISGAVPSSFADASKPAFSRISEGNWMWGIIIAETDRVVTSGIVNWISHMGSINWGYATFSKGKQINKALYNTIPTTDARKGWWVDEDVTSVNLNAEQAEWIKDYVGYRAYTQVKFAPYNDVVGTSTNANDIPLMRIEEMYLIKAEAEAMGSGDGKATLESFVKTYRDPDYVCQATGASAMQEEIFRHRRIELWGEGMNWFDIMRLNKGVDRRGGAYPNASMVFNIPAGSDILLWRIPEAEVQANPGLDASDNNPNASVPEPVPDFN